MPAPHLPLVSSTLAADATPVPAPHGWPLLRLGFRPFYLGAALFALLAMPLWVALFLGQVTLTLTVPAALWHAHEMLFGLAVAVIGTIDMTPMRALHAGLALIVMIECVMAGRVVPAFTMSAAPGLRLQVQRGLETTTLATTALALVLWVSAPPGPATAAAFTGAAVLQVLRQLQWRPLITRRRPILWILHVAYAWIAIGFALLALAQIGWVDVSAGVHALAIGATGGLVIGMIIRTARGHTGRQLRASKAEVLAYALVMSAATLRVLVPLVAPQWLVHALIGAAFAWCAAFAIDLSVYSPWLLGTRLDGKDD
ncbi:MAG: NnrS family protein [Rubrivivax sp.]|nr:NnrS family protein [Rubrivivax sp.]